MHPCSRPRYLHILSLPVGSLSHEGRGVLIDAATRVRDVGLHEERSAQPTWLRALSSAQNSGTLSLSGQINPSLEPVHPCSRPRYLHILSLPVGSLSHEGRGVLIDAATRVRDVGLHEERSAQPTWLRALSSAQNSGTLSLDIGIYTSTPAPKIYISLLPRGEKARMRGSWVNNPLPLAWEREPRAKTRCVDTLVLWDDCMDARTPGREEIEQSREHLPRRVGIRIFILR